MALRRVQEIMGMPVTVQIVDGAASPAALEEVFDDFCHLDQTFSTFMAGSEVSRINRAELRIEDASDLVHQAINLCRLFEHTTCGYFSAWIGDKLELSGLVKGWAIDRGCSVLDRWGFANYFIDAGGDVQTRGLREDGTPWRVGIRHPVVRDKVVRVILAKDLAVATSGTYEKGNHIFDPHTGRVADELLSLTVVGPDILHCDVFATAAFAMGRGGLPFIEGTAGYEAYAIDSEYTGTYTSGFSALCVESASQN
jgi:FAD:protein FMN transferase